MLYRKWCCICNILWPRKLSLQWAQHSYHLWFSVFFGAIPVAVHSTHCKSTSFGRWWLNVIIILVALSWCSSFFDGRFRRWCCNIRPRVRQVALHCISTCEWKCLGRKYRHTAHTSTWVVPPTPLKLSFASTSSLLVCGCYDECNNEHAQYTRSQLIHV